MYSVNLHKCDDIKLIALKLDECQQRNWWLLVYENKNTYVFLYLYVIICMYVGSLKYLLWGHTFSWSSIFDESKMAT